MLSFVQYSLLQKDLIIKNTNRIFVFNFYQINFYVFFILQIQRQSDVSESSASQAAPPIPKRAGDIKPDSIQRQEAPSELPKTRPPPLPTRQPPPIPARTSRP